MALPILDSPSVSPEARPGISGLSEESLAAWLNERGASAYRARQIRERVWGPAAAAFSEFRTLPAPLRAALTESFRLSTLGETTVQPADEGRTEKALHLLGDGRSIESVLMRYPARGGRRARATICISSQAGCAVGCPFCATGELGLWRDLETAEIVDQARFWSARLTPSGERVTNVVFMGMGEPFLNTEPVIQAAAALSDPSCGGIGARHITISTSGVVPGIDRLTELRPQYTLAVSLHAARPALRDLLVPLNARWPQDEVVAAAARYARATGRRVTYEAVMIDGINDTPNDAAQMATLLTGHLAHVNLIPMNVVAHTPWRPSPQARVEAFAATLRGAGLSVTVRRNRGFEIGAACGQLAAERAGEPPAAQVARRRELLATRSADALHQPAARAT